MIFSGIFAASLLIFSHHVFQLLLLLLFPELQLILPTCCIFINVYTLISLSLSLCGIQNGRTSLSQLRDANIIEQFAKANCLFLLFLSVSPQIRPSYEV